MFLLLFALVVKDPNFVQVICSKSLYFSFKKSLEHCLDLCGGWVGGGGELAQSVV